jgi:hypothetical protein
MLALLRPVAGTGRSALLRPVAGTVRSAFTVFYFLHSLALTLVENIHHFPNICNNFLFNVI